MSVLREKPAELGAFEGLPSNLKLHVAVSSANSEAAFRLRCFVRTRDQSARL